MIKNESLFIYKSKNNTPLLYLRDVAHNSVLNLYDLYLLLRVKHDMIAVVIGPDC